MDSVMCLIAAALESISEVIYTRTKLVSKFYFSKVDSMSLIMYLLGHKVHHLTKNTAKVDAD
jgi:hypothetical protein